MQSTSNLLSQLEAAGLSLALELRATPASRLTPELRQIIREHKPELLHYLGRVAPDGSSARVSSVSPEGPGKAGCVIWKVEKPPDQPILPLEPEKRAAEKPVKSPPSKPVDTDTLEPQP